MNYIARWKIISDISKLSLYNSFFQILLSLFIGVLLIGISWSYFYSYSPGSWDEAFIQFIYHIPILLFFALLGLMGPIYVLYTTSLLLVKISYLIISKSLIQKDQFTWKSNLFTLILVYIVLLIIYFLLNMPSVNSFIFSIIKNDWHFIISLLVPSGLPVILWTLSTIIFFWNLFKK